MPYVDIFSVITAISTLATAIFAFKSFSTSGIKIAIEDKKNQQIVHNNRANPILITRYIAKDCTLEKVNCKDDGRVFYQNSFQTEAPINYYLYCGNTFVCKTRIFKNNEYVDSKCRILPDFFNGMSFDNFYIEISPR